MEEEEYRALLITIRRVGDDERRLFLKESETRSLLETLAIKTIAHASFTVKEINPNTLLGPGQLESAVEYSRAYDINEVIVDSFLSPRQEKNLEEAFGLPVSDREALILSIFYQNARSREARLQIERAQAIYMKPRLTSREMTLSQQRGGVRGAKGEGEKKLELDRRKVDERIKQLDRDIEEIKKMRATQRKSRDKSGLFSFALTGYTNSGKSTILNAITGSDVLSEDKLFATLDTTTRLTELPNGQSVLLSDTVGFISNLPHDLIDAFSSTLDEALSSDAIIIVADASHPDVRGCFDTTMETIKKLGAEEKIKLLVINKMDQVSDDFSLNYLRSQNIRKVETSFKTGEGKEEFLKALSEIAEENYETNTYEFKATDYIPYTLFNEKDITNIEYKDYTVEITARIRKEERGRYSKLKKIN